MALRIDSCLSEIAEAQLGLITRAQAGRAGIDRGALARRVACGQLVPMGNRVFRLAGVARTKHIDVLAACLDVGGVASHRTAAWLHQLEGFACCGRVEVTVMKNRQANITPLARIHTSTCRADDTVLVGVIPTTSIARTLLGLASLVPHEIERRVLIGSFEEVLRQRRATEPWLWWFLEKRRVPGRNGVREFERVLAERAGIGPTESWLEREALRILTEAGLPLPKVQRVIESNGRFVSRVDFLYPEHGIVIEVDGAVHGARTQRAQDARQSNELQMMGYTVLRFTYDHIVGDPQGFVRTVARALRMRPSA